MRSSSEKILFSFLLMLSTSIWTAGKITKLNQVDIWWNEFGNRNDPTV